MITVISPAKKLNFDATSPIKAFSQCQFLEDSKILVNQAKDYSFDEIMNLMSVSKNIANLTVQRFNDWSLPFNKQNAKQAALAFNGDTYTGFAAGLPTGRWWSKPGCHAKLRLQQDLCFRRENTGGE